MISIVVPVYKVRDYLPGCLDSILANDTSDCEIILVDDGSPDDSGAICDRYAQAHPDLIRVIHQDNGGLGAARNTGVANAKGEWLFFIDSDDPYGWEVISEDELPSAQWEHTLLMTENGVEILTY